MAKRDKLTQRQQRQVAKQQHDRLVKKQNSSKLGELSSPKDGLLISRFGDRADILDLETKQKYRCFLRQNLGSPVTGDLVSFRLAKNNQGVVEAIKERHSILQRPAQHQGLKPVVANISHIFVVIAPLPDFSAVLLDRYLVAARETHINCTIVANKWDLSDEISKQNIEAQLAIYTQLGYPLLRLSATTDLGIAEFILMAKNEQSILVGQSGVGKSSIINQIFPKQLSNVKEISKNSRLGQHTTTASQLFLFDGTEGFIIDSPGIREFSLWHMSPQTVAQGFIEFEPYLGRCKFRDCQHTKEPGCAIIKAVEAGKITKSRWRNYCKIITDSQK